MTFPAYPEYKDSGVEWLGEIPKQWDVKRAKYLGQAFNGLTYSPNDVVGEESGILVLRSSNIQNGKLSFKDNVYVDSIIPSKSLVIKNDILICSRNGSRELIGKNVLIPESLEGVAFGAFMMIFRGPYNNYLYWVFNSQLFKFQSSQFLTSTINQLVVSDLYGFEIPLPSLTEQTAIAIFLDHETTKIDALISEQEKLIELLNEKRQSIISNAVCRGLDPNVPMKDSGVDWLGMVPEHWNVKALKHIVSIPITDGPHETPEFIDEGVPFVSAEAVSSGVIDFSKIRGFISRESHEKYSLKYFPKRGDIFMVKSGATTGVCAVVETDDEFNIWSPLAVVRCVDDIEPNFVLNYMRSLNFQEAIALNWNFGTQQNIGMGVIENLMIPMPPHHEQIEISKRLSEFLKESNDLISEVSNGIALLKERRSALISAAVTGQIDVRNFHGN